MRRWRPWEQSTGPQTAEGKARASRNANRGGHRGDLRSLVKMLNRSFREQRDALISLNANIETLSDLSDFSSVMIERDG